MNATWRILLILICGLPAAVSPFSLALGQVAPPEREYHDKFYQSFKDAVKMLPKWHYIGQYAPNYVRFEADGLRITLPAGNPQQNQGNGVIADIVVAGDFEITLAFEMLSEPVPADAGLQTRLSLRVDLDRPGQNYLVLSRRVTAERGNLFSVWKSLVAVGIGKEEKKMYDRATRANLGRLRMVRTGPVIENYVAEGAEGDFKLLQAIPAGLERIKEIGVVAATGGAQASLDVRVTDFLIRADSIVDTVGPENASEKSTRDPMKGGLALGLAIALMMTLLGAGTVWLLVRRHRGRDEASNK